MHRSLDDGVSATEMMHLLLNLGENAEDVLVDEMIALVDEDANNEISFEEFYQIMVGGPSTPFDPAFTAHEFDHSKRMMRLARQRGRRGAATPAELQGAALFLGLEAAPLVGDDGAALDQVEKGEGAKAAEPPHESPPASSSASSASFGRNYSTEEVRKLFDDIDTVRAKPAGRCSRRTGPTGRRSAEH